MATLSSSPHPAQREPSPILVTLAYGYIYLAWGATYLGIHVALGSIPPFLLVACRFLIAGSVMLMLLRLARPADFRWGTAREWKDAGIVGLLLLVSANGVMVWAQQVVPSGLTALIFGGTPLWIIFFDWMRPKGTAPSPRTWIGLAMGLIGVAVLVDPGDLGASSRGMFVSELALVFASCSWAAGAIYSRYVQHANGSPLLPMARQMLLGGTMLLVISLLHGDWNGFSPARITVAAWLGFGYLVTFGSLIGFTIYIWLMRVSTPGRVGTISYVNLVVAVFLGWLILDEPFTPRLIVGAVITVAAVILVLKKPRSPNEVIDE